MNIKKTVLSIISLTILGTSCNVLDQEPQGSLTPELAFIDEKSARNALVGLYDQLQPEGYYGAYFQFTSDNFADVSRFQGFFEGFKEADNKQISGLNGNVATIWASIYRTINLANEIITKVPAIEANAFTDIEKAEIVGAARCIRALCYLDLLMYFGEHWDTNSNFGLPLIEKSTGGDYANIEYPTRSSVKSTYDFIRADLEIAKRDLKDGANRNYATKGFAQGLLARAALFQKDYAKAIEESTSVIANTNYELIANYEDIFKLNNTKESIFELAYLPPLDGSSLALFALRRDEVRPESGLISSFTMGDKRKPMIGTVTGFTGNRFKKYEDNASDGNPAYVMRKAEMYLIRSEAYFFSNEPQKALDDINAVRTRAGISAHADVTGFETKIADEYRWEFFAEGHRMRMLAHLGLLETVLATDAFRRIYPIPQRELNLDNNKLVQNPGY